jgi:imidazolonepropionase
VAECRRLFTRARELGHPLRLHADQFNSLGGTEMAIELGALSVDHLEASPPETLARLARSETFGVMLPASGFSSDDGYGDGRRFWDLGGKLVLASNCNPGSAPTSSMPLVVALAVRKLGLSSAEAITACTANAAALLSLDDRGVLEIGKRADLVVLRHRDERALAFELGGNPVDAVFVGGQRVEGCSGGG